MKLKMMTLGFMIALIGCANNPHKAEKINTDMERKDKVTGEESLGVKDGNLIVQKKVVMSEELRDLQNEVYGIEDQVYGNRKYGSIGAYGKLRGCKLKLSDPKNGGDGKLKWTEPIDRVTDKEEEFNIGIDEKNNIVGVSEEFLKDRIKRFKQYKSILQKRQDEYNEKVEICEAELRQQQHVADKSDTKNQPN